MRRSVCLCVLALHSAHTDYGLFDVFGILLTVGRTELKCSLESMNTGQTLENQQDLWGTRARDGREGLPRRARGDNCGTEHTRALTSSPKDGEGCL